MPPPSTLLRLFNPRRFGWKALIALAIQPAIPHQVLAQTPAPSVSLGFGVDTTIAEVRDIVSLTRAYVAHPDSSARAKGLWSTKSAVDARYGDLASEAYQGFPATIVGVIGTGPGDSVFVVRVLHASADSDGKRVTPFALQRFYAVRAPGSPFGWQLSSPLTRLVRVWRHRNAGRITFWYEPGQPESPQKARAAARFVDSVARLFSVPPPTHLDAYVAGTMESDLRLTGLDFSVEASGPGSGLGGRGGAADLLLLANPALGEAYLHEFVHAVLNPRLQSRNLIFEEGVAVWLGGSENRSLKELYSLLRRYQNAHPEVSMREVFDHTAPDEREAGVALNATRGLIVEEIYRSSGISGLLRFAKEGGSTADILKALPSYLPEVRSSGDWWRSKTSEALRRYSSR